MASTQFVADSANSLDNFINAGLDELHELLVEAHGSDFYESSATLSQSNGVYALPSDFFHFYALHMTIDGERVELRKYNRKQRNALRATSNGALYMYRMQGSNIRIEPTPPSTAVVVLDYAPARALLTQASDTVNFPNGWEQYAVLHAAIACKQKEESDPTILVGKLQKMEARIREAATARDSGEPERVTDVTEPYVGGHPRFDWGE